MRMKSWRLSSAANACLPVILHKVPGCLRPRKSAHNAFMQGCCHNARRRQQTLSSLHIKLTKSQSLEEWRWLYLRLSMGKSHNVEDRRLTSWFTVFCCSWTTWLINYSTDRLLCNFCWKYNLCSTNFKCKMKCVQINSRKLTVQINLSFKVNWEGSIKRSNKSRYLRRA